LLSGDFYPINPQLNNLKLFNATTRQLLRSYVSDELER
jgi:hypothetical protein